MYHRIQALVSRMAEQFNTANFLGLAEVYVFPLPVQVNGQLVVLQTSGAMVEALAHYHRQNTAQGLAPSNPQIVALDLPRNGRFRLWVDWTYGANAGPNAARTQNLYYCSAIGARIQIEMVQFLNVAAKGPIMQPAIAERRIA
jgi:hypothetical protein